MNFDITSMKMRAKALSNETKPSPMVGGFIIVAMNWLVFCLMFLIEQTWAQILLAFFALLSSMIAVSFDWYCLLIAREEKPTICKMFDCFTKRQFTVVLACILKPIIVFAMFMLMYVPGIIAFYWLRPLNYIIRDNPDINIFSAIKKSIAMMKGHKLELFKLDVTLIGWHALSLFTGYIAGIYVYPYTGVIYAEYYEHLKGQAELFAIM